MRGRGPGSIGLHAFEDTLGELHGPRIGKDRNRPEREQFAGAPCAVTKFGAKHDGGGHDAKAQFDRRRKTGERSFDPLGNGICRNACHQKRLLFQPPSTEIDVPVR